MRLILPLERADAATLTATCFCHQDAEARALVKERQKKDNHNLSEFFMLFTLLFQHVYKRSFYLKCVGPVFAPPNTHCSPTPPTTTTSGQI